MNRDQKSRPLQLFSEEYLDRCREMSPESILEFLETFREMVGTAQIQTRSKTGSQPISLRIPKELLTAFKTQCDLDGVRYQSQIVSLMRQHLKEKKAYPPQTAP